MPRGVRGVMRGGGRGDRPRQQASWQCHATTNNRSNERSWRHLLRGRGRSPDVRWNRREAGATAGGYWVAESAAFMDGWIASVRRPQWWVLWLITTDKNDAYSLKCCNWQWRWWQHSLHCGCQRQTSMISWSSIFGVVDSPHQKDIYWFLADSLLEQENVLLAGTFCV